MCWISISKIIFPYFWITETKADEDLTKSRSRSLVSNVNWDFSNKHILPNNISRINQSVNELNYNTFITKKQFRNMVKEYANLNIIYVDEYFFDLYYLKFMLWMNNLIINCNPEENLENCYILDLLLRLLTDHLLYYLS